MYRLVVNRSALVIVFMALSIIACNSTVPVGGSCEYTDEELLARVANTYDHVIELEPAYGETINLAKSYFKTEVQVNDYYTLFIRRHTSGGCNPFGIRHVAKAAIPNVILSPSIGQAYMGAFVLDEAKNCAHGQLANTCNDQLALDASFDTQQLGLLEHIKSRSLGYCSAATMKTIWQDIEIPAEQQRLISCVEASNGEEIAIEFSIIDNAKSLLLRKIY